MKKPPHSNLAKPNLKTFFFSITFTVLTLGRPSASHGNQCSAFLQTVTTALTSALPEKNQPHPISLKKIIPTAPTLSDQQLLKQQSPGVFFQEHIQPERVSLKKLKTKKRQVIRLINSHLKWYKKQTANLKRHYKVWAIAQNTSQNKIETSLAYIQALDIYFNTTISPTAKSLISKLNENSTPSTQSEIAWTQQLVWIQNLDVYLMLILMKEPLWVNTSAEQFFLFALSREDAGSYLSFAQLVALNPEHIAQLANKPVFLETYKRSTLPDHIQQNTQKELFEATSSENLKGFILEAANFLHFQPQSLGQ